MLRDPNRPDHQKKDFSLPRSKILRGRRNYQRLFEKSSVLNSSSLQFRYRIYPDPAEGCYIGFLAPKKRIGGAVHRNRIKRLLREVYRIHQSCLQDLFLTKKFGFHGVFMAREAGLSFSQIKNEMVPMLEQVRQRLLKTDFGDSPEKRLPGQAPTMDS